jgi:hypothetical protein
MIQRTASASPGWLRLARGLVFGALLLGSPSTAFARPDANGELVRIMDGELFSLGSQEAPDLAAIVGRGANINHKSILGFTVLHYAARKDDFRLLHSAVALGANVNAPLRDCPSALFVLTHRTFPALLPCISPMNAEIFRR